MEKITISYMNENGNYVTEEVTIEETTLEETNGSVIFNSNWLDGNETLSANSMFETLEESLQTTRIDIASIPGWPEFKIGWKMRKIGFVKTKVPQAFTRTCHRKFYVDISYPGSFGDKIKKDVIDCAKIAAGAAAGAAIATGTAGAAPAFEVAFKGCVVSKIGTEAFTQVKVNIGSDAQCNNWTPR